MCYHHYWNGCTGCCHHCHCCCNCNYWHINRCTPTPTLQMQWNFKLIKPNKLEALGFNKGTV